MIIGNKAKQKQVQKLQSGNVSNAMVVSLCRMREITTWWSLEVNDGSLWIPSCWFVAILANLMCFWLSGRNLKLY